MGRDTKTPFTIYADTGIPTPDSTYHQSFDDVLQHKYAAPASLTEEEDFLTESEDDRPLESEDEHDADEEDAARRASAITATSISSLPDSAWPSEAENASPSKAPYTPSKVIRPSFRRPSSVRRMQMTSPPPFEGYSPRHSILRGSRSGTPRSMRALPCGSPRPRTKERQEEKDAKEYPLVLLHVTLLPIVLPWSAESMLEILPAHALNSLQLLRTKVTDTVLQRGILIPHPREEYDLLEERMLEALELKEERVTKCGHFRRRESADSSSSSIDSDSGLGSSEEGFTEDEHCTTCKHPIKTARNGVGTDSKRWTLKIFAANGLMRANAWSAAWSEMERIDVEIRPWMSDELQRRLDERREEEDAEKKTQEEDESERIKEIVEEQVRLAVEQRQRMEGVERRMRAEERASRAAEALAGDSPPQHATPVSRPRSRGKEGPASACAADSLPEVYKPKDVPLSVLLKNYIYLLAQDRRNVAIFFLGMVALFLAYRPSSTMQVSALAKQHDGCSGYQHDLSQPESTLLGAIETADVAAFMAAKSTGSPSEHTDSATSAVLFATGTEASIAPTEPTPIEFFNLGMADEPGLEEHFEQIAEADTAVTEPENVDAPESVLEKILQNEPHAAAFNPEVGEMMDD